MNDEELGKSLAVACDRLEEDGWDPEALAALRELADQLGRGLVVRLPLVSPGAIGSRVPYEVNGGFPMQHTPVDYPSGPLGFVATFKPTAYAYINGLLSGDDLR